MARRSCQTLGVTSQYVMSKRPLAFIAAGFVVALLWTPLVSNLFPLLPIATSRFLWRATQFFVGLFSALVLVLPIAIAMRPVRVGHGAILLVAFLVSLTFLHLTFGGTTTTLIEMFQLPDIWAFFGLSACIFWLLSSRNVDAHA